MPLRPRILFSFATGFFFAWSTYFVVTHPRISSQSVIEWVQLGFYFLHLPGVLTGFAVAANSPSLRTPVMMLANGGAYSVAAWFVLGLRGKPKSPGDR